MQCDVNFSPIGPTLLKNPLDAGWGLLPTLPWASFWRPAYLANFLSYVIKLERRFHIGQWIPLHYHR
jgi:hypothetical protein